LRDSFSFSRRWIGSRRPQRQHEPSPAARPELHWVGPTTVCLSLSVPKIQWPAWESAAVHATVNKQIEPIGFGHNNVCSGVPRVPPSMATSCIPRQTAHVRVDLTVDTMQTLHCSGSSEFQSSDTRHARTHRQRLQRTHAVRCNACSLQRSRTGEQGLHLHASVFGNTHDALYTVQR
jgi:hypothetical protein